MTREFRTQGESCLIFIFIPLKELEFFTQANHFFFVEKKKG
jgi:hypothetical protein